MSYKRKISEDLLSGEELTRSMIGIGILFGGEGTKNPNIENTIISASLHGIRNQDFRVLSMVTLWLEKHFFILNASRLIKLIEKCKEDKSFLRFWVAVSQWQAADNRFKGFREKYSFKRRKEISSGAKFLSEKNGYDLRFINTCLIVPKKMLEKKDWLVLDPKDMVNHHSDYRWRLIIGPSFRADMWSQLEQYREISASELAKNSYGSYATAHRSKKEYEIFKNRSG